MITRKKDQIMKLEIESEVIFVFFGGGGSFVWGWGGDWG